MCGGENVYLFIFTSEQWQWVGYNKWIILYFLNLQ